jgi:hypothetical protein
MGKFSMQSSCRVKFGRNSISLPPTCFHFNHPMPRKTKPLQAQPARAAPALARDEVLQAIAALMRPVIRLALHGGIDYTRFAAELKPLFIEQALAEIENAGQGATDSAISLLSGVHRKDVRNWRVTGRPSRSGKGIAVSAKVFAQWTADPAYATRKGKPRTLVRTGPSPSFETLVRTVTQDIHPFTVLQELIRLGIASVQIRQGRELVVPTRPDFVPPAGSREALELLAASLADHALAAVSNVLGGPPRLEQSVFAAGITAESAQRLDELARTLWNRARAEIVGEASRLYEADRERPDALSRVRFGSYFWSGPWTPSAPPGDNEGHDS